jgi:hypothetical protein
MAADYDEAEDVDPCSRTFYRHFPLHEAEAEEVPCSVEGHGEAQNGQHTTTLSFSTIVAMEVSFLLCRLVSAVDFLVVLSRYEYVGFSWPGFELSWEFVLKSNGQMFQIHTCRVYK